MTNSKTLIRSGDKWIGKVYQVYGKWSIEDSHGEFFFVLDEDFATNWGPDLKLYLARLKMSEIDDRNPVDREGELIAALELNKGRQRYRFPKGIDLSQYNSIVIHCKAYSVVWGGIEL